MDSENRSDIHQSRTQAKKASAALQKLGERLTKLSPGQLKSIDIPDDLRNAILDTRDITSNKASCRNRQFIGALMRTCDPEPIHEALDRLEAGLALTSKEKPVQNPWVKAIIDDEAAIEAFLLEHPTADRQRLRQLRRNAIKKATTAAKGKTINDLSACILKEVNRK